MNWRGILTLRTIREYLIIAFGLLLYTLGWTSLLIPHKITGGGASGIGALIYYVSGFPVGYTFLIFNVVLILIAMRIVGASFGVKTIFGVIVATIFFSVEPLFITSALLPEDRLLSSILGGVSAGLGIGLAFSQGGSTGGTDIIAMIASKYWNTSPGRTLFLTDMFIIGSAFFVLQDMSVAKRLESIVYGFIVMGLTAYTIDAYLNGLRQSVQVFIFSKHHERVADRIIKDLQRGVTVIDGKGWYSQQSSKIIITMLRKNQSSELYRLVKQEDPEAFMSVGSVMGVYGKGFDMIRAK